MPIRTALSRPAFIVSSLLAAVGVAGCDTSSHKLTDYRVEHPIAAQEKVFGLKVALGAAGGISNADVNNVKRFAMGYLRRGRGPFLISHDGSGALSRTGRSAIYKALRIAGVPGNKIYFQSRSASAPRAATADLSYAGYVVRVPDCGDWSGRAGFDPTNRQHTDFGCSYQRNMGLMISNPADLSVPGGSIESDSRASDRIIRTYRDGKQMGTPAPKLEQKEFSDVAK